MVRTVLISLSIILLVSMSCVPVASAITEDEAMHFFLNIYNPLLDKIVKDIPLIDTVFGGQVIHIVVEKPEGNIELGAVTNSDGYITELTSGKPDNPTLRLISTEAVVEKVRASDDPVAETNKALKNGDIYYEGIGVKQEIGVTIVKVVFFFADLFGII
ncbi:MAG: hypothetical protein SCH39_11790 [Methanosarcinales archaeon]|nr:hypothetical protein [ANME-2 cluster archaeon]MDW7776995.1 hypothetical protein [Methanosarcinales archaeon]